MQIPSAEQSVNEMVRQIHSIARASLPLDARIGLVLSPPPNLQIAMDSVVLDKNDLYIDAFLLTGYQRSTSGQTTLTNMAGDLLLKNITGSLNVSGTTTD